MGEAERTSSGPGSRLANSPVGIIGPVYSLGPRFERLTVQLPRSRPKLVDGRRGDRRFGVLVRIQYAAALNRRVSLGVVSYSELANRSHTYRTRLIAALGPPSVSLKPQVAAADCGLRFRSSSGAALGGVDTTSRGNSKSLDNLPCAYAVPDDERAGTVRPRGQIPGPDQVLLSELATKSLVVDVTRHRSNLILALLCAAQFMLILDIAIVNVALPSMQRTLSLSAENIQWVVSGYALTFGGFLMLGGRLADVVGRRRIFVTGLVLFIAASMLGATFKEGPERNRALGIWSAMAAGGASAGLILGGLLTQELSWRFTLFVNVPLGLAAVLLSPVLPADAPRREEKVNLDVPGAVSLTVGILALAYGVTEATGQGFASTKVLIALALSAALLIAFVVVEKSSSQPLLPARMLKLRSVVAGNSVAALVSVVMIGAVFFNSLYLQEILGYSPIQAGLAWLPQTVLIMVVSSIGARIATKLGERTLIALGTLVLAAGMLLFLRTAS